MKTPSLSSVLEYKYHNFMMTSLLDSMSESIQNDKILGCVLNKYRGCDLEEVGNQRYESYLKNWKGGVLNAIRDEGWFNSNPVVYIYTVEDLKIVAVHKIIEKKYFIN